MKALLFIALLLSLNQVTLSQVEKLNHLAKTVEKAYGYYLFNQNNLAKAKALEIYNYDFESLTIPENDYVVNGLVFYGGYDYTQDAKSGASEVLGYVYFKEEKFDSALYFLEQVLLPGNSAGKFDYNYTLEMDIHLTYLKSICLERMLQKDKARAILIRYLFLDRITTTHGSGRFTHRNLVDRYKELQQEEIIMDTNNIVLMPDDSIDFYGWHRYNRPDRKDLYYKIDTVYCPILPANEPEYNLLMKKAAFYPGDPDMLYLHTNPNAPKIINYQKAKELLLLMYFFQK